MDKIGKNKLAMYKSLKTIIAQNEASWTALPAFANAYQTFVERLEALEQRVYQQNLALVGVSAVKDAKKAIVVDKAYAMSSAITAYAVANNDLEVMSQMKISKHELQSLGKEMVLVLVNRIISRASSLVAALADFGITQASVDELITLRNELDAQMNAPRNAIIDRKGQTLGIKTLTREIDAIVKLQLDKLLFILKEDHPQFFIDYKNARIIVDHRNRKGIGSSIDEELPPEPDDGNGSFDDDF